MKLPIVLVLFTLLAAHVDCRRPFLPDIFESFTNKTSQLTNFIRQRGRDFKKYYIDNVKNRIASYFVPNTTDNDDLEQNDQLRVKRKFKHYVTTAQSTESTISNAITSTELMYKCSDDDPMIHMTTPQLLALNGYRAESHTILTDDGYLLTVHRIPFHNQTGVKEDPRRTVLLHHGLLGSSADWVIPGPGKGLAYILSDAGYDVWMANVRGNTYSRAHINRPVDSFAFWNFSFHEVSQHDLPSIIDYIMEIKGWDVKINYIGHSMGTTVLFALLSTKVQYNKVLRAGYALAPVAYMTDIKSPIKILAKFANNIDYLMKLLGANEFLPQNTVLRWLSKHACEINHYEEAICENSMFVLCGHDEKEFNRTLLPIILGHVPAGASTKTLVHYAQIIHNGGRFQQYDYGPDENFIQYGTYSPPEYSIPHITLPIALLSAENDWLSGDVDVTNLFVQLANPLEHYIVPMKEFNHIDFLWAIDAPKLVYSKLLQMLEDGVSSHTYFNPDLMGSNELNDYMRN
ncbi:lipase 3-like [Pectinophora gossypiella]|nr:lipase 3-like [Pectinophora gossypiella]